MIKKIFGFLFITVLLWSCGSQFSRSKYDRHMWNRSHGKSEKELKATSEETKSNVSQKTFSQENENVIIQPVINHDSQSLVESKSITINKNEKENKLASASEVKKTSTSSHMGLTKLAQKKSNTLKKKIQAMNTRNNPGNPTNGGGDANLVILVILAIILPPLGVYLKDGSITGLFWLTLILCLVGGGGIIGLGFYFGGLYGLAAILALLRVFDII